MNEPQERYGNTAITLHWLIALLIFVGFAMGWTMTSIHGLTPTKVRLFSWHKWIGVTVFLIATIRVLWRLTHKPPALPPMSHWQRIVANVTHITLYAFMIVIPLSGYLYTYATGVPVVYFGLIELPPLITPDPAYKHILKEIHETLNFVLAAAVILHVLAALVHQFVQRDGLLTRMLPRLRKET